jgi:hypothetical protein
VAPLAARAAPYKPSALECRFATYFATAHIWHAVSLWHEVLYITETNRTKFVLFGMQNRVFGPYSMTNIRILIPVMEKPYSQTDTTCAELSFTRMSGVARSLRCDAGGQIGHNLPYLACRIGLLNPI